MFFGGGVLNGDLLYMGDPMRLPQWIFLFSPQSPRVKRPICRSTIQRIVSCAILTIPQNNDDSIVKEFA